LEYLEIAYSTPWTDSRGKLRREYLRLALHSERYTQLQQLLQPMYLKRASHGDRHRPSHPHTFYTTICDYHISDSCVDSNR